MLPDKSHPAWKKLVNGKKTHQFKSIPAGLCVSRLVRKVSTDNSKESVDRAVDELYSFFEKYEKILSVDINAIFKE
ncbi:MAG: hypothetical protein ACLFR1_09490 [Spirochaetia bacterium]